MMAVSIKVLSIPYAPFNPDRTRVVHIVIPVTSPMARASMESVSIAVANKGAVAFSPMRGLRVAVTVSLSFLL